MFGNFTEEARIILTHAKKEMYEQPPIKKRGLFG